MRVITGKIVVFVLLILFSISIFTIQEKNKLQKRKKQLLFDIEVLEWNQQKLNEETQQIEEKKQQWQDLKIQRDLLLNESLSLQKEVEQFEKEIKTIEKR